MFQAVFSKSKTAERGEANVVEDCSGVHQHVSNVVRFTLFIRGRLRGLMDGKKLRMSENLSQMIYVKNMYLSDLVSFT